MYKDIHSVIWVSMIFCDYCGNCSQTVKNVSNASLTQILV